MAGTPNQVAQKWQQRLSQSTQQITDGVNGVQQAPGAKAAQAKALWVQQVTAAADKWAARTGAVTLDAWKSAMINKGIPRVATGAQAATPKVEAFMTQFLPHVEAVAQRVRAMPKGGLANGIARATAQIQGNATFKRS